MELSRNPTRGSAHWANRGVVVATLVVISVSWTDCAHAVETVLLAAPKPVKLRFAAELGGVGFRSQIAPSGSQLPSLIARARAGGLRIVVRVGPNANRVQLWATLLTDRSRQVTLNRGASEPVGAIALRTAEWLHAWVTSPGAPLRKAPNPTVAPGKGKGTSPDEPKGQPVTAPPSLTAAPRTGGDAARIGRSTASDRPTRSVPTLPAATTATTAVKRVKRGDAKSRALSRATSTTPRDTRRERGRWLLGAGVGASADGVGLTGGGLGPGLLARVRVLRASPTMGGLSLGLTANLPLRQRTVRSYAGQIDVSEWSLAIEGQLRLAAIPRGAAYAVVAVGIAHTTATGRAKPGFSGDTARLWSATARLGAAASVRLYGPLHVRLQVEVGGLTPRPVFIVDDIEAAAATTPSARAVASIEVQL